MEYLMTYGWAILVVVAVVAALYGLGVFKVGTGSVKCSPCFSYFAYVDYTSGNLILTNGPNAIKSVTGTGTGSLTFWKGSTGAATTFSPGDTINITGVTQTGKPAISITYVLNASDLSHTDTATIQN